MPNYPLFHVKIIIMMMFFLILNVLSDQFIRNFTIVATKYLFAQNIEYRMSRFPVAYHTWSYTVELLTCKGSPEGEGFKPKAWKLIPDVYKKNVVFYTDKLSSYERVIPEKQHHVIRAWLI